MTKYIAALSVSLLGVWCSVGLAHAQSVGGMPIGSTVRKPPMGGVQLPLEPLIGMRPGTEGAPVFGPLAQPTAAPAGPRLPALIPLLRTSLSDAIDVEKDMLVVENLTPGPFRLAIKDDPDNADINVAPGKYVVRRCRTCTNGAVTLLFNDTKENKELAGKLKSVFSISWNPTTESFAVASKASSP